MKNVEQIIEALLFASPDPLTQKKINSIFDADPPDRSEERRVGKECER